MCYCGMSENPLSFSDSNTSIISFDQNLDAPFNGRMKENQKLAPQHPFRTSSSSALSTSSSLPPIVVSFRGHLRSLSSIAYCSTQRVIISASFDCSVRMWSIFGQFIGIFGQDTPWQVNKKEPTNQSIHLFHFASGIVSKAKF